MAPITPLGKPLSRAPLVSQDVPLSVPSDGSRTTDLGLPVGELGTRELDVDSAADLVSLLQMADAAIYSGHSDYPTLERCWTRALAEKALPTAT